MFEFGEKEIALNPLVGLGRFKKKLNCPVQINYAEPFFVAAEMLKEIFDHIPHVPQYSLIKKNANKIWAIFFKST